MCINNAQQVASFPRISGQVIGVAFGRDPSSPGIATGSDTLSEWDAIAQNMPDIFATLRTSSFSGSGKYDERKVEEEWRHTVIVKGQPFHTTKDAMQAVVLTPLLFCHSMLPANRRRKKCHPERGVISPSMPGIVVVASLYLCCPRRQFGPNSLAAARSIASHLTDPNALVRSWKAVNDFIPRRSSLHVVTCLMRTADSRLLPGMYPCSQSAGAW